MSNSIISLDIAKNIFHLFTLQSNGKTMKKKLKLLELVTFFANYPTSLIGMEACGGSHHWAREFTKPGHEVVLLNARYVKGFMLVTKMILMMRRLSIQPLLNLING